MLRGREAGGSSEEAEQGQVSRVRQVFLGVTLVTLMTQGGTRGSRVEGQKPRLQ